MGKVDFYRKELIRLQGERKRNMTIKCVRVAARIQREIDEIYREIAKLQNETE